MWVSIVVLGTVFAVLTGPQGPLGAFWGAVPAAELGIADGTLLALIAYGVVEAIGFGLGVAWFVTATPMFKRGALAVAAYLSIGWMLVSWFPHGALHQVLGHDDFVGLAAIEWGFHATMLVAAVIVGSYLWRAGAVVDSDPEWRSRA